MFDQQTKNDKYDKDVSRFHIALNEYKELFTVGHLRKRTMVACLLQVIQQFTGISKSIISVQSGAATNGSTCRCNHLLRASVLRSHRSKRQLSEPSRHRRCRDRLLPLNYPSCTIPRPMGPPQDPHLRSNRHVNRPVDRGNIIRGVQRHIHRPPLSRVGSLCLCMGIHRNICL